MSDERLDEVLAQHLKAVGIPGDRVRPKDVARLFGVPLEQARRTCRRLARQGLLKGGRTTDKREITP